MLRYSCRLQGKRERVQGKRERILPNALLLSEPFQLRITVIGERDDDDERKEIGITVKSTDSVGSFIQRIESICDVPQGITRVACRKRVWRSQSQTVWLNNVDANELLCNCYIGPKTRLYVVFDKSADAGFEYYQKRNYKKAAAHLSVTLADPDSYPDYAAEYADICLRNLDGVVRPRQEAAKWYLIASKSCDETVFHRLCSLSPEFARKIHDAREKEKKERTFFSDTYRHRLALVEDLVGEWNKE